MVKKIFCDAGHGLPQDSGAVGNGLKEAEVVLLIQQMFEAYLKENYSGFETNHTRTDNKTFLTLSQRANKANKWGADVFISFHCNSAVSNATGYEEFVYTGASKGSKDMQAAIHKQVLPVLKKHSLKDRGSRTANYAVLRLSDMPAVLTETLFVSNASDARLLKDMNVLREFASAYAEGVAQYLKLPKKTNTTPSKKNNSQAVSGGQKAIGTIKVLVNDLWYYDKPDWNAKKGKVNKGTVLTVVKELTVDGSKMYALVSGTYITAYKGYVQFTKK
jgi:N-acetylmuramoyl-L-alanine amidase